MNLFEFFDKNSLYVVLFIALIIWFGLFFYIWKLDAKVKKLITKTENEQ